MNALHMHLSPLQLRMLLAIAEACKQHGRHVHGGEIGQLFRHSHYITTIRSLEARGLLDVRVEPPANRPSETPCPHFALSPIGRMLLDAHVQQAAAIELPKEAPRDLPMHALQELMAGSVLVEVARTHCLLEMPDGRRVKVTARGAPVEYVPDAGWTASSDATETR